MASFRNPPPEGFIFPNASEKRFLEVLEDLPSRWAFWYEPTVSGGQRPDFVIWVPAEEFPTIFLIELKSWRKNFVSKADLTHVQMRNNRVEYNPISKLKMVRNNLNEALMHHFRSAPGLEKVAVIPLLIHWAVDVKDAHPLLQGDSEVSALGRSQVKNPDELSTELINLARDYYSFVEELPPVVSSSIKRAIFSSVDLSIRVEKASGRIAPAEQIAEVTEEKDSKTVLEYEKPIAPMLDEFQVAAIRNRSLGHGLLSGVPGTGKTIMLLGRMRWYQQHNPKEQQLFVVHQKVLIKNLEQKYQHQFAGGKLPRNIRFFRFKDWFTKTYEGAYARLQKAGADQLEMLDTLVEEAIEGKLSLSKKAIPQFGHIFVDEAHQMPTRWIHLLTRFARADVENKPNIWIAYDNGQGIYSDRRFEGRQVGLNFQGRSRNFHRVYRCGLLPWAFAACCHPEAFHTYRKQNSSEYLEFTHLGESPLAIEQPTLEQQAKHLAKTIRKKEKKGELKLADVTIFYAVAGFSEKNSYPDEMTKAALDKAFEELGGIEWVAIHKSKADWTSEKVRACTFTSSQGIDAPVSVLFGAESFQLFSESGWVNPDALFYTVLTRATKTIILTYNKLSKDSDCRFQQALFTGTRKAKKLLPTLKQIEPIEAKDGQMVYRIRWANLDQFIQSH